MRKTVTIGITDCSKFRNYERWIMEVPGIVVIRLGYSQNNFPDIHSCDGILLTGGEDIHPRRYGHPEYLSICQQEDMDELRDEFEWRVLEHVTKEEVPLLGICRGLQISNAFFGGTLIPDIPSTGKPDHAKVEGIDRYHPVQIEEGTMLSEIVNVDRGQVNSAHHQSVDAIGSDLRVTARSTDGIIEGLERVHPELHPFFQLVQWHPERMKDQESPLVGNLRAWFIRSVSASIAH